MPKQKKYFRKNQVFFDDCVVFIESCVHLSRVCMPRPWRRDLHYSSSSLALNNVLHCASGSHMRKIKGLVEAIVEVSFG